MKESISVTVLMPAYNAAPYIKEAIESVLAQTYHDFEFLIVNDGSTDNTLEIINSFGDRRIKLINQTNKGLITTLNESIAVAAGNVIARMDADDVCMPDRLEKQVKFLEEHPEYIIVGGEADVIDKDGNFLYRLIPVGHSDQEIRDRINIDVPFIHPSVMFRKIAALKAGGYPKNALHFEDHLLWKKMLEVGKVYNLKDTLLNFRFNPESVTIDEKWIGKKFSEIRKRSVLNGSVTDSDTEVLKSLIVSQNFAQYKKSSYYAMVGKKYLWNNPNSNLARKNLGEAIRLYPKHFTTYMLFLFSFLPAGLRMKIYRLVKNN